MIQRPILALCLLAAVASPAANAAVTTLNFDGAVSTDITNAYSGLTFRAGALSTGPVRTWEAAPVNADTGGNVLGLAARYDLNQADGNAIDVIFDTAVSYVSIRASFLAINSNAFSFSGNPFMAVYSGAGFSAANRLGADVWDIAGDPCLSGNLCQSGYDTLEFNSAAGDIKGIRLSGFAPGANDATRRAIFDTLVYGSQGGGGGGGGGTVPLPSSLALALLGLALTRGVSHLRARPKA
jgi:hypothetical protein